MMTSFQQQLWGFKRRLCSFNYLLLVVVVLFCKLSAINALKNDEVNMGTTILAVRYKGGVVVGADTRTSVSGYVSNRFAAKLTFVLDREVDEFITYANSPNKPEASTCVICRSGSAADTQHLASIIRTELVSRQLLYKIRGTVTHVASLLRNILANESLSASLICAGYDSELGRGVIYTITPGGTVFEEKTWAAGGSGSTYILGHLDSCHPKDLLGEESSDSQILNSEEEALDLVSSALSLAMDRDGSSGGFIRMYVINKDGKRFVSKFVDKSNKETNRGDDSSNVSLRHFAPASRKTSLSKTTGSN